MTTERYRNVRESVMAIHGPRPEVMHELSNRIMLLRSQLAAAEEEYNRYFSTDDGYETPASQGWKDTAVARVMRLLRSNPSKSFRAEEVSDETAIQLGTTRTTLSKLVKMQLIEKRGTALYGSNRESTTTAELMDVDVADNGVVENKSKEPAEAGS